MFENLIKGLTFQVKIRIIYQIIHQPLTLTCSSELHHNSYQIWSANCSEFDVMCAHVKIV